MPVINLKRDIIETILVRGGILTLNFAIIWLVTFFWKAEGNGIRALFMLNIGIIAIFCNIFTSSSVSYFLRKVGQSRLATQAYLWIFLTSGIFTILLSLRASATDFPLFLFIVSVLLGFLAFHSSLFIGCQKIPYYNLITLLQPVLLLLFMLLIYYVFDDKFGFYAYFYAQILALLFISVVAKVIAHKTLGKSKLVLDKSVIKASFNYGWKTELSNLLQFLNYRISMYVLLLLSGVESVGVFAIGVSLAEAIWIFSRSISLVQYSNVLQTGDTVKSRKETGKVSLISFLATAACIAIVAVLPANIFSQIFNGEEFSYVKNIIILLSPGILAIAISNVYGNFFSAIGKLNILILKSAAGVVVTLILSLFLISEWGIAGACIVNSSAYIVSSVILFVAFFYKKPLITSHKSL